MSSAPRLVPGAFSLGLFFSLGLSGCGGGAAAEPPPNAPPGAPPAAPAGAAPVAMPLTTTVNGVAVSNKGDHFTRVTVTFKNPGGTPCKVSGYTVTWGGGKKSIPLEGKDFVVAPGASEVRAIRIHPSDGDLNSLISPDGVHVETESDCK